MPAKSKIEAWLDQMIGLAGRGRPGDFERDTDVNLYIIIKLDCRLRGAMRGNIGKKHTFHDMFSLSKPYQRL